MLYGRTCHLVEAGIQIKATPGTSRNYLHWQAGREEKYQADRLNVLELRFGILPLPTTSAIVMFSNADMLRTLTSILPHRNCVSVTSDTHPAMPLST